MDASFQAGSNGTIGGHVWHRRPCPTSAAMSDIGGWIYHRLLMAAPSARTNIITWDCSHWPLHVKGRGLIESCRLLLASPLSSRSGVIRNVFSLPMPSSLVCWIGPTAVRKKVARVPQGRVLKVVWLSWKGRTRSRWPDWNWQIFFVVWGHRQENTHQESGHALPHHVTYLGDRSRQPWHPNASIRWRPRYVRTEVR